MYIGIVLILIAWFVEMPLWLSIVTTVIAGLKTLIEMIKSIIKALED